MDEQQKTEEKLRRVARVLFANGEIDLALLLLPSKTETEKSSGRV